MDMIETAIREHLEASAKLKLTMAQDTQLMACLSNIAAILVSALRSGNKILFAGNGGSAADAQHLAAEFVCRFEKQRRALPALALTTDTSILTAVANDLGYENIFARQIYALAQPSDVLVLISTSGNSNNILRALEAAHERELITIGFTGLTGLLAERAMYPVRVPDTNTARIQEAHISLGHVLCRLVEAAFEHDE